MIFVYYLLNIILYVEGLLELFLKSYKQKSFLYVITLLILIAFVGLKLQGGTDIEAYKEIFNTIHFSNINHGFIEPLFAFVMCLIKYLGGTFGVFYFLVALTNLSIKCYVFKKLTPYFFPALLIYSVGLFFERDNDGIRQGLSIAFCYLSIPALLENRNIKFICLNLIAILIHYTSVVFLLIWLLRKIRWNSKWVLAILCIAFLFPLLKISVVNVLFYLIPVESILVKLTLYADSDYAAVRGINIGLLFRMLILFLFMYYHKALKIREDLYYLLRNGFAFAIILSLLFYDFEILAHRLPYVFREFQIFIVPYFFTIADKKNKVVILSLVFLYSLVIMSRFLAGDNAAAYDSYDNILFHLF